MGNNRANLNVPAGWSQQDRRFGESIKQNLDTLQGQRGDKLDRAVTFRDLLDAGIVKLASGIRNFDGNAASISLTEDLPNLDVPPAPTNLTASGAFQNIILAWDMKRYLGHSAFEVYRHTSDVISSATLVAQVSGFTGVYSDAVGPGVTFYYWVRAINQNGIVGPYNSSTGTQGQTAPDVNFLLSTLTSAITSSELASSLSTPIGQIPGINTSISTINGNITTINGNITQLDNFVGFDSSYSGNSLLTRMGAVETTANGAATSAQLQSEQTTRANADSALASDITTLQSSVGTNTTAIQTEQTARANADSAIASDVTSLTTTVGNNAAAISAETTARSNADSALASDITSLNTATGNNAAAISAETTARSNADSALASDITTLNTTVSGNSTSISTQATSINGLEAQYTVKIDNNGAVAGYGLASTTTAAGGITSEFIVNADRFAIMRGGSNTTAASVPFAVQASATTINGVAVPAGVYMSDAFVKNGSIVNAKIGNAAIDNAKISSLSADKLTAGTVNTSRLNIDGATLTADPTTGALQVNQISANKINTGTLNANQVTISNLDATDINGDINVFDAVNTSMYVNLSSAYVYYQVLDQTLAAPDISHQVMANVVMQATKSSSGGTQVDMKITMTPTGGSTVTVFEGGHDHNFSNGSISQAAAGSLSSTTTTSVRVQVYAKKHGKGVVVTKIQGFIGGIR